MAGCKTDFLCTLILLHGFRHPRPPMFPIYPIICIRSYKEPIFQKILYFPINRTYSDICILHCEAILLCCFNKIKILYQWKWYFFNFLKCFILLRAYILAENSYIFLYFELNSLFFLSDFPKSGWDARGL